MILTTVAHFKNGVLVGTSNRWMNNPELPNNSKPKNQSNCKNKKEQK